MSKHINGTVLKFKKELEENDFIVDMGDNSWKIYRIGQPFYLFHPAEKGIHPCKRWIQVNYKIDLRNQQKKNLTKREQRANMGNRLQSFQQQVKLTNERFNDMALFLKRLHPEVYEEYMERYE